MTKSRTTKLASNIGDLPCRHPMHPPLSFPTSSVRISSVCSALTPPRKPCSAGFASSCVPPTRTSRPTCRSPRNAGPATTPSGCGVGASLEPARPACRTPPAPADRRSFPPSQRLHVVELATKEDPATVGCPTGSWSLADLAVTILQEANQREQIRAELLAAQSGWLPERLLPMSPSTIARILTEADLKPHKSA